jgi:hypothetical protein
MPCRPHRDCRQQIDRRCMRLRLRLYLQTAWRRQVGSSHRQGYIASAQACEDGSVAEGGQRMFERQSDITTRVARSTSYLGHTPVGGQVTTAEQPVSVARDDLSRSGRGGEHRSRLSFSWPTTACTSLSCPPTLRRERDRAVRAVRLAVPVPKFKPFQTSVSKADSRAKSGVP